MKKINGFTTIELIVSFSLLMVIIGFLFQMLLALKELYISTGIKTDLLTKQSIISHKINGEFINKTIIDVVNCGNECLTFTFNDGTSSNLMIDRDNNIIQYGEYKTYLIENSSFGEVIIINETDESIANSHNNSIIQIKIPITHPIYQNEDYGINVIYQYDNRIFPISNFSFIV